MHKSHLFKMAFFLFVFVSITANLLFFNIYKNNSRAKRYSDKKHTAKLKPTNDKLQDFRDIASRYEYGIWLWKSPLDLNKEECETILSKLRVNKFNRVYITTDDFLTIKKDQKMEYFDKLYHFVKVAKKNNIIVDVVVGDTSWAKPEFRHKACQFIEMVVKYNSMHPDAKLNRLQYDIEPYLLDKYNKNKKKYLTDLIAFTNTVSNHLKKHPDIGLSIVIPHFYDNNQDWTPKILYNGIYKSTFEHINLILRKINNSTLIIMAYRNYFFGKNGVNDIIQVEFNMISEQKNPKLIVAQETTKTFPRYTSFYGHSQSELFRQLNIIYSNFGKLPSFGGIAIHSFDGYFNLSK